VLDHLPERDRPAVKARLRRAWKETDHDRALEQLNTLALELDHAHPGAAASLREGLEETLTVTRLGITGKLKLTLQSTNPCESMISTVRVINRNVKNWSLATCACAGPPPGCLKLRPASERSRATGAWPA
jgi:transposase-like protein